MSRPHSYVRYLQLQSLMARAAREMEALENTDVNFRLDREFSAKLGELVCRYGYTDQELFEFVELVHAHETRGSKGISILMSRITADGESAAGGVK